MIQLIKEYIKAAPSAGAGGAPINVGDPVTGGMIPLPSPLTENIPRLVGARFAIRNGDHHHQRENQPQGRCRADELAEHAGLARPGIHPAEMMAERSDQWSRSLSRLRGNVCLRIYHNRAPRKNTACARMKVEEKWGHFNLRGTDAPVVSHR